MKYVNAAEILPEKLLKEIQTGDEQRRLVLVCHRVSDGAGLCGGDVDLSDWHAGGRWRVWDRHDRGIRADGRFPVSAVSAAQSDGWILSETCAGLFRQVVVMKCPGKRML